MHDEDYEIVEKDQLDYLRHEVEKLKRNPLGDTHTSTTLLESMNRLNANVQKLVEIFSSANADMLKTYHDQSYQEQLRKIRSENAKIAHGIVAIAEMIKQVEATQERVLPSFDDFLKEQRERIHNQPEPPRQQPNPFEEVEHPPSDTQHGGDASSSQLPPGMPDPSTPIPDDEIPPPPPR